MLGHSSERKSSANWTVILLGLGFLVVVALAVFYRSAGFNIEVTGPGGERAVFRFEENRVSLSKLLDQLFSEQATKESQRLVKGVLRENDFYCVPSTEAAAAIREIDQDDQKARDFVRDMRRMLYDLAGPFALPGTFAEANDTRLLKAFDDLYENHPTNPLVVKLWEMGLESTGFLGLREVTAVTVQLDRNLRKGVAATCLGSVLLEKAIVILAENQKEPVEVILREPKPCKPTSSRGLLKGEGTQIWISQHDMDVMFGESAMHGGSSFTATIIPFPKHLRNQSPTS